jgi:hypothetical protein
LLPAGFRRLYVAPDTDTAGHSAAATLLRSARLARVNAHLLLPQTDDWNTDLVALGLMHVRSTLKTVSTQPARIPAGGTVMPEQQMSDAYPKSARLTDELVRRFPFTSKGQAKIRDEECRGLLLVIGMETKIFSAKVERVVSGICEFGYESFGSFDPDAPDHVGVKEARKAAAKWIADYKNGAKVAAKRGGTTLKEAWVRYKARLEAKGRQARTINWYRENLEDGPLKDWFDTQLASITPEEAAALHARITKENGLYRANQAMRTLRAVYNHAKLKVDRALPQIHVAMLVGWNAEKWRNTGVGLGRLPAWGRQLAALENPVRREFHLLCLLSGSRPEALSKGEWCHVSVARRVLHIPASKGGDERAFDIHVRRGAYGRHTCWEDLHSL